jgi:hypothetical protein
MGLVVVSEFDFKQSLLEGMQATPPSVYVCTTGMCTCTHTVYTVCAGSLWIQGLWTNQTGVWVLGKRQTAAVPAPLLLFPPWAWVGAWTSCLETCPILRVPLPHSAKKKTEMQTDRSSLGIFLRGKGKGWVRASSLASLPGLSLPPRMLPLVEKPAAGCWTLGWLFPEVSGTVALCSPVQS